MTNQELAHEVSKIAGHMLAAANDYLAVDNVEDFKIAWGKVLGELDDFEDMKATESLSAE